MRNLAKKNKLPITILVVTGFLSLTCSILIIRYFLLPWWSSILILLAIGLIISAFVWRLKHWRDFADRKAVMILQFFGAILFGRAIAGLAGVGLNVSMVKNEYTAKFLFSVVTGGSFAQNFVLLLIAFAMLISTKLFTFPPTSRRRKIQVPLPGDQGKPETLISIRTSAVRKSGVGNSEFDTIDQGAAIPLGIPEEKLSRLDLSLIKPLKPRELRRAIKISSYDSDRPPLTDVWVGRERELKLIQNLQGVVAVTGIGGQGKSTFVAKALASWMGEETGRFWDWRDCREHGERFRVQLLSLIERMTDGDLTGDALAGVTDNELARLFLHITRDVSGFLVFDNVDHYTNSDNGEFVHIVHELTRLALLQNTGLLIVFTCRPSISYPDVRFREIPLKGLSVSQAEELFDKLGAGGKVSKPQLKEMHQLTSGHPFWLTMISTQLARQKGLSADQLITGLEKGQNQESGLRSLFRPLWGNLNDNHRVILQIMCELSRPETASQLQKFCTDSIKSQNQFSRAFRALRAMNLTVTKTQPPLEDKFELHPLVRQFVRSEFTSSERKKYAGAITNVIRIYIDRISSRLTATVIPIMSYEYSMLSIELNIEHEEYLKAISTWLEVLDAFFARGLGEELLRAGSQLVSGLDWSDVDLLDNESFHTFIRNYVVECTNYGALLEVEQTIDKYKQILIPGTSREVGWCDVMCQRDWILRDFESAIRWGEKGFDLKRRSDMDTNFDTTHHLNLARRDSGDVDKSLSYFSRDLPIADVLSLSLDNTDYGAHYYGNLGRCYWLKRELTTAFSLYIRSMILLERSANNGTSESNRAWASMWLGEVFISRKQTKESALFLSRARDIWTARAPLNVSLVEQLLENIDDKVTLLPLSEYQQTKEHCESLLRHYGKAENLI